MLEIRSGKIFFIGLGQVQEGQNHANLLFHSQQRRAGLHGSLFALRNFGVFMFMLTFLLLGKAAWGQVEQKTSYNEGIGNVFISTTSGSNNSSSAKATTNSEIAPLVEIDTKNEFSGRITNLNGANRTHIKDEALNLLVSFTISPVVDMTNGTPYLEITVGSTTKQAAFVANLGLFLQFAYTITDGDSDTDGVEVNGIVLNGSTIRDSNGLDFDLTLPANANSALTSVLVDGIVPNVTSVTVPSNGTYIAGNDLDFTVNYTEPVSVTGTPQLSLIIGSTTRQAIFQTGSNNTNALLFRYTVQSGDEDTDGIAVGTLTTNGATLLDGPGNSAGLVLTNIGSTGNVKVDAKSPEVNSVTVPADGTYPTGQDLDFTVNFDEAVTVTGTPQLSLTVGSTTKQALYQSGSGSTALLFRYTVQSGDEDTDGIAVGTLAANGGTLQDGVLQDANLTLNNVGTTTNINVDAVVPTVISVAVPSNGTYTTGQNLDFTINFDEAVTITGTPQLSLTVGSATKQAVYQSGSGSTALLFRYTAQSGDEDTDGIAVGTLAANGGSLQDGAGNDANLTLNNAGATTNINVDAKDPEVSSVTVPADGTYGIGSHLDFTVNFDEVVTVTGTPQLSLTVGSATKQAVFQSGSGSSALLFRYTVQSGDADTDGIAVGTLAANGGTLQDGLLNDANLALNSIGTTTNIKVNHLSPIVNSSQAPSDGTYTLGQELNFTVVFDKDITANTTNGIPYLEVDIGGNIRQVNLFSEIAGFLVFQYHVQTNDLDVDGIRLLRLVLNGGILQDGVGNDADISGVVATDYPNLKVDGVVPAVTNVAVPSDGTYTAGQDLDFTVNFDDVVTVTGTPQLSLTIGSATKQGIYQSGSGSTALLFRYTVQSGDEDTDGIAVGALAANGGTLQDGAGNDASLSLNNIGATTNINVDAKGPEVVSVTVPADGTYTTGQHLDFIVNFDEVLTLTGTAPQLVLLVNNSTVQWNANYLSGSGTQSLTFRYTVQAGDEEAGGIGVLILTNTGTLQDGVGNTAIRTLNSVGSTANVIVDAKAPELDAQASSPTDGATNVTLSQNLSLTFDDNMVVGTGNITIVETGVGNFEQLDVTNGSLVTISNNVVTLNPSGTLKKATAYHLLIDATALDDDASISFAGVTDPTILNFSTVDVVINEIVTDPQQDWSSTNFASTPSSGSSGTDDEWVELFIKSPGIDLTGWTIELLDGSDVIGDLSNTGAFDVSNYTSSGSGTFTNTAVGDYLVLGNVASSGALNNTGLTINLKDPGGAIVDVATVGVANPPPFPGSSQSGNSNGVSAESVQRFANGSDTNIDLVDFTFGPASIAAANTGPSVTLSIDNSQISETGTATITATRSANSAQTTTVTIDVKSGSEALEVTDFTLSAKTITIPNGATTGTVTLTAVQDALFELDENTTIEITGVANGTEAGNQETSLLILNSDAQPVIAFSSTSSSGDESTSSANLEVTLSAVSGVDATVNYTVTGTATNIDYTLADGALTIPAGSTSQNITIASIVDDALDEVDETVIVTLSGPGNATLGTNTVHTYTITDNDPEPTVSLTVDNGSIVEAAGTATLTATLSAVSSKDVTVNLGYTGTATIGTDFNNTVATSIVITAGNLSASASPIITVTQDNTPESNETIIVDVTGVTNGTENGSQQQTVTIIDDDAVQFSVDDPTVTEGNAGTTTLTYTVSLNNAASGTVTVDYATADGTATAGSDYTALNATTITFAAGETSKTVDVSVIGDQILEGNETINLDLSNATGLSVIADAQGVGSITNDDAAAVTIADVSGAENGGAITVTATLDNAVQGGFTVDVSTADGTATTADSDYAAITSQTLTFAGTAGETQTFTVTPTADTKLEANETLTISQSNLSATTLSVAISDAATVTFNNDDAAAVTIADISGAENGGAITVTATLDNAVQGGFTVDVSSADGTATTADSDYAAIISQTLTFAGTAGETQTFMVIPTADTKLEANETLTISQGNLSATTLSVAISDNATVTITNDDAAAVTIADVSGAENGGAITVTATLDNAVQGGFTVDVSTADGTATTADSDYTAITSQTLTFAGTAGETQTFTVTPTADTKLEADETLTISQANLSATTLSVAISDNATVTITNDDAAAVTIADVNGAENGGAITVTATLDNAVQGGFTVDVSSADGTATTADSDYTAITSQTLTFAGTAGETQTFTVTPTADTKLEANETLTISQANLSATTLSVAISDGATVTITNDDAAAVTIAAVSGAEDAGAITVTATLDNAVDGAFTVDVSTADGTATIADSDYTAITSQTLTFAGTAGETQTFTVTPTADATSEGNETIQIIQSNLTGTALAVDISDVGIVTISNDDDGTAPIGYTVSFDDALIGGSEVTTSKFTFAGAEVGTTYNYTVSSDGGGTNVTGSGTITTATDQITLADLSGLNDGTLTLSVTLTDPSSNVGVAVTASTSKDATAPAAPVVSSITTDSGANGADGITNDNTLSFNGTAEANATVEVFIDAASIGTTTADATGQWSFNHETATLTDAIYAVTATATDAAGNATSSSALNVTVDTAAPSAPVVDLAASSDSGVSSTDNLTSDNTPTLIGTAEANAIIEVFINGNSLGTTTADGSGNWSITVGSALGDGVNSVTARATDTAGNSSAVSSTLLIVIDTVVPVDPVVTSPAAVTVNAATQTISGTHPGNGATVHVYADADNDGTADNTTSLANAVISGSVWSLSVNLTADSDNNFVVKAIDGVGNESGDVDVPTITEDSTVPADPVVTIPASVISLNAATQAISGTHAENGVTVHAYADADNDGTADNTTSLANAVVSGNTWSLSVNLAADSDNNFVVKATDGAGNESSDVDVPTITEDSTVPADPVVTSPASVISLNSATQTISGTHAENGVTVHVYADADNDGTADNTTSLANAVVSSNAWSLSVNLIADSDNNFVVKATDGAGNESGDVDVPTITEDSTIPTITNVTSSTANGTYGVGDQVSIQVEFSEAVIVNGTGLQLGLETGLDLFVALASGSGTSTLTFDLTIPVGHKTSDLDVRSSADLTITSGTTVKDAAGNSASLTLPTGSDANSLATNKDIIINSEPTVSLSVDNSRIDEATGTATLTATLSAVSPSDVTVTIAYSGTAVSGTDYNNTASTSITVIAGQVSADAAVIITPVNDINPETNETIIADITGVTNGAEDGVQQQTITIVDDDSPSVSFANLASSGAESTSSTDLTVNTTIASALTVTVDYTVTGTATGGGIDYTLANGTLTFNPGSTSENITIAGVIDDAIFEANETVIVTLSNPTNANLGANTLHTYTITDNDAAAVTIADISGVENGGAITVTATLDNAVQGGFTVDVSTADGTATTADNDYTAITSQTLTFAGTAGETQTFTVTPIADTKLEADETLTISQANLSATTLSIDTSDGATVTITNDDAAAVTIADVSGAENGGAITITATLDNAVQGGFTVDVSTADGTATTADSDFTAITSQTLTFAGTAGETQTFTVTPTADATPEGDETVQIVQGNLTGTALAVNISNVGIVTISNDDDGIAPIGYAVSFDDALIGGSEVATSKFTFSGAEVGATYDYTVSSDGGGTNVTGSGTITTATDQITLADLSGLSDGTLTLSVTLTDPSGNVGAAVTASTSKDATSPSAPVVSCITTDSGANGTDGITNDNTLSFNGTAEANATVEVFIDAASIGSTTADATGQWSFNHETATLADATYAVTGTATDPAGNTSSSSAALSVTVDTTAPSAPVVNSITTDSGANGTDQNTNDPTLSFNGTAQANVTVEVFIDAVSIGTTTADGAGQWSFNHESTTLSDASYSVTARATDVAGNTSAESLVLTVTIDTAAPVAPTIDLDASFDTGTSNSDNLTNATTLKFNGVAEANADVEVFINDVSFGVTAADVAGAWTLTTSPLTLTGGISVKAIATDQVGNTGPASQLLTVTIDVKVTSPVLSPSDNAIDVLPTHNLILTFAEDVLKGGNNISVRKSSDDSILESFDVSSAKVTVSGSTVTIDLENTLPPATKIYVTIGQGAIVDKAGNDYAGISNSTNWSFTTIAASVVSSVAVPTADTYGIGHDLDFTVTMALPVTITGAATIPVTIGNTTVNATQVGTVSNSSTILFRYTVLENELDADGIAVGTAINLNGGTMKDAFGVDAILGLNNVASTAAVLIDGVRPTPTITNANTTDPVNGVYTVFVEFDETVAGFSATDLSVSNGSSSNFTAISNDKKWSFDITPTADGTVNVSLAAGVATDNAGNTSAAGTAVSKTFDGTAPTVSSIARKDADQLNTATTSADFRVIFSEDVLGVDLTDFEVALTGTTGTLNTITRIDAKTYDVNVNGISGQGTIGLNVKDDDSILDNAANQLGGTGLTNGDFTGEFYTTNFLPTDIISTPASISENNAVGDVVGALTSTDADAGDSHSYTLVSGTGDTDNVSFSVDGSNLKAAAVFDFEAKDSYSIRVKTDDGKGGSFEKALTITIDNVLEPSIFVTGDATFDISALGLSQTRTLTVTNDGEKPVEVRVTSTPAGFSVLPGALVLVTGASADVTVTFVPTAVGNFGGDIIFSHEGGLEAHPVSGEGAIITSVDDGMIDPADITIYPNPASRLLTIDLSELNGSKLDITVINATGTPMFNKEGHTDKELTLDVSGYQMGIYIVQFTNGQSIVRKKVMIKR